jgi:molecular chaperone GrpE
MSERQDEEPRIFDRRASTMPDAEDGQEKAAPLESQLEEEREKAQSFYASWQRSAADFQNYKRRVEQEREEFARFAGSAWFINILPIVDDIDRAIQNVEPGVAATPWFDGLRLIQRKFEAVLDVSGVKEIEATGAQFDPNLHEAVAFGEGEEGKVINVVQKGYTLNGRVLRPAMVVVGKGKERSA